MSPTPASHRTPTPRLSLVQDLPPGTLAHTMHTTYMPLQVRTMLSATLTDAWLEFARDIRPHVHPSQVPVKFWEYLTTGHTPYVHQEGNDPS